MNRFVKKIGILCLRLLASTWRISFSGDMPQNTGILAFWHGGMLPVWYFFSAKKPTALVSKSHDGEILADLLQQWGYTVLRGSSSSGGKEVLQQMVDSARGRLVLITPDGPRGPRHVAKAGAAVAAMRSGARLYPIAVAIYNAKYLPRSWDNFAIPMPFSRVELQCTTSISIPHDAEEGRISSVLHNLTEQLNAKS